MTPENVKKFETLLDLFSHAGWNILVDELEFKREAIKEGFVQFGVSPELLSFGQGRIQVYDELRGLPALIENALKQDTDDEQETPV